MIVWFQCCDVFVDFYDNISIFMIENSWEKIFWIGVRKCEFVCVINVGGFNFYQYFEGVWVFQVDCCDFEGFVGVNCYCCMNFYGRVFRCFCLVQSVCVG